MGSKQYAGKQLVGCGRNQRGNLKIHENRWKWKHNDPKSIGCSKSSSKGEIIAIQDYLRKQEKCLKEYNSSPKRTRKIRTKTQSE